MMLALTDNANNTDAKADTNNDIDAGNDIHVDVSDDPDNDIDTDVTDADWAFWAGRPESFSGLKEGCQIGVDGNNGRQWVWWSWGLGAVRIVTERLNPGSFTKEKNTSTHKWTCAQHTMHMCL